MPDFKAIPRPEPGLSATLARRAGAATTALSAASGAPTPLPVGKLEHAA